ncbi:MAG: LacI family DNA-binding transcriptional regulator [Ilumatobacter sp.]
MSGRRSATLQTVADHLGVSRTTVSNAYNRPDQLSEELRTRILDAAAELGYRGPAAAGRMLRTGRMGAIGLLFTEDLARVFADPNTALFMQGLSETTAFNETAITLLPVPVGSNLSETAVHHAAIDGVIVFSVPHGHPALAALLDRRLPTVTVDQPNLGAAASYVGIDDREGARLAAGHLLELGHRRLGVLLGRARLGRPHGRLDLDDQRELDVRIAAERLAGYRSAMTERGLDPDELIVWHAASLDPDSGRNTALELLEQHPDLTGLLCFSDGLAIGATQAAQRLGLVVPDDLSVVGFDDVPRAAAWDPPLTTVHQSLVDKGRVAAELLAAQIRDGRVGRVMLPIGLVERGSTSAPRS